MWSALLQSLLGNTWVMAAIGAFLGLFLYTLPWLIDFIKNL